MPHAAIDVISEGFVYLNGTPFRLKGPVSPVLIGTPPTRQIVGSSVQQRELILNELISTDAQQGLGLYKMADPNQTNFSWFSLLNNYRQSRSLPEEAVSMGAPTGISTPGLQRIFDHGTSMYGIWNNGVYKWDDTLSVWGSLIKDLGNASTDAVTYLYNSTDWTFVADGTQLWRANDPGTTLSWAAVASTTNAKYVIAWDNKIIYVDSANKAWVTVDNGANWVAKGSIPVPLNYVTGLAKYYDGDGNAQVYARTKSGLYALSYTAGEWLQTKLEIPAHIDGGKGGIPWRNDFYFSAGMDVYRYIVAPTATVSDVGLNRLDGLPAEMRGTIVQMASGHNELYTLLDSSVAGSTSDPYLESGSYGGFGGPFSTPVVAQARGYSSVCAWNGVAWRVVWRSSNTTTSGSVLALSQASSKYRLVWGVGQSAYYIDLPRTIRNPQHNPTQRFQIGPLSEQTPWFNAFSTGRNDLAVILFVHTSNCAAGRTVTVEYGLDLNDSSWYPARNLDTGAIDNVVTTDGLHEFAFDAQYNGVVFDWLRFQITLQTDDPEETPFVNYIGMYYAVIPRQRWGHTFTIELDDDKTVGSAFQQRQALMALVPETDQEPALINYQWHNEVTGEHESRHGLLTRMVGSEESAGNWQGQWTISMAQIYP